MAPNFCEPPSSRPAAVPFYHAGAELGFEVCLPDRRPYEAMAESSTCQSSSTHSHPHPRPGIKRKHHTWHGGVAYRSHFEDFMREIGEDTHLTHLCCMPRQAQRYERTRANSEPPSSTSIQQTFLHSEPDTMIGRRQLPKGRGLRRPSAPAALGVLPTFSHTRERVGSHSNLTPSLSSPKVRLPLKAPATISIELESQTIPCLYSLTSVGQRLRCVMQTFQGVARSSASRSTDNQREIHEDQEQWMPLPAPPALVPGKSSSSHGSTPSPRSASPHSVSRAPSFASLDTVSSSEGPATPRGHSPLHSPVRVVTSPALSYLENTSRIRVPGVCITCRKAGNNYPYCSACGDSWCSRECRVVATGGRKHNCHRRTVEGSEVGVQVGPFVA